MGRSLGCACVGGCFYAIIPPIFPCLIDESFLTMFVLSIHICNLIFFMENLMLIFCVNRYGSGLTFVVLLQVCVSVFMAYLVNKSVGFQK